MIIRDQVHGTIEFNELEEQIIDSESFQRLRRIKQMSVTNLVYPGANHTRFEHSIGTSHLSWLIAKKLGFDEDTSRKIKLYGLLHDIGHTTFSHEGEDVLKRYLGDHESLGKKLILGGELKDILSETFDPKEIAAMEHSHHGAIITSDLGSDRMDYLKRDALNTGVAYGMIDIDRIVHTLAMEKGELCIEKGGLEAAEYLLIARFMMFSAVYLHHTVRIATAMLYRAIDGALSDGTLKPKDFTSLGDEEALAKISQSKNGSLYANALLTRKLYKEVATIPRSKCTQQEAEKLEKDLSEKFKTDIIVDYPHPFFKPVALKVKTPQGLAPITELSGMVKSLKSSEEERMMVLILANQKFKEEKQQKLADYIRKY
ncbi:HD domain-containing protein [Candidatus Micrarchaeota archaeon]|nr:HD domain-containing protein [Candidatus Micrarchaeota archaeon]